MHPDFERLLYAIDYAMKNDFRQIHIRVDKLEPTGARGRAWQIGVGNFADHEDYGDWMLWSYHVDGDATVYDWEENHNVSPYTLIHSMIVRLQDLDARVVGVEFL